MSTVKPGYIIDKDTDPDSPTFGLTAVEREALALFKQGKKSREVADEMSLVKQRISAILSNLRKKGFMDTDGKVLK